MTPTARLRLRVVPGAKRPGIVGRYGDGWKVCVAAPAERGAANDAVVRLLADTLAVPPTSIEIVSGHGGRDKTVRVAGVDPDRVETLFASAERKDLRR